MEGFAGGFLGALQQQNESMKAEVDNRRLGIDLQKLDMDREKQKQTLIKENGERLEAMGAQIAKTIQAIGPQFQIGSGLDKALDQWKNQYANWLKMSGQDPELAGAVAESYRQAARVPQRFNAAAGTHVLQVQPDGSLKTEVAVPPNPPALIQSAQFAAPNDPQRQRELVGGSLENRGRSQFSAGQPVIDGEGNHIGTLGTDLRTGQPVFHGFDGTTGPMPEGARVTTASGMNANTAGFNAFNKLATEANQIERSVQQLSKYMQNVQDTEQGWRLVADQLRAKAKTVFGSNLDQRQIDTLAQQGRLQGLLGQFREDVVGGGVMTEQDAQRVLQALGGDATWTRNRDVVADLLKDIVQNRVADYNSRVRPQFNEQLKTAKRGDIKPKDELTFDNKLFSKGAGALKEAKDAIARGAPRDAVIKRLREMGVDPAGL